MQPCSLTELEDMIRRSLPPGALQTGSRSAGNNIVICLQLYTSIPYSTIEALRMQWEAKSSWNIAVDTFYHSRSINQQTIDTILQTAPSRPEIKGIVREGRRIVIYTTNVSRLFGRNNKVLLRLRHVLDTYVQIQAADTRRWSSNLEQVDATITHGLECGNVYNQVQNIVPSELWLRTISMEVPTRTLTLMYGTSRMTEDRLAEIAMTITDATGWSVTFRKVIDSDTWVRYVKSQLPNTLPKTDVGFFRETETIRISCFGDLTHKPILEGFASRMSQESPIDVTGHVRLRDELKSQIIRDMVPAAWALQKVGFGRDSTAMLDCMHPPEDRDDPVVVRVLDDIRERIGHTIAFKDNAYKLVRNPELIETVKSFIPASCGFSHIMQHVLGGSFHVFVRRNIHGIKVRAMRNAVGKKNIVLKVVKEAASQNADVRDVLNIIPSENAIVPVRVVSPAYGMIIGYGACEEVGRSAFYFELSGLRILVDCGASFGSRPYPEIPLSEIKKLDFVFLSHAHSDHAAMIPWLYENGCTAQLIATEPTLVIAKVLCEDYLKVQQLYRHQELPYRKESITRALEKAVIVGFDRQYQLGEQTYFTFLNAGHLLGSAMILFEDKGERVLYSGDISAIDSRILRAANLPEQVDHVVMETTYGGRAHQSRADAEEQLLASIETALERGGTVIIPSFAVGRAQEILTILSEHPKLGYHRQFPVYVDGMILEMNDIHRNYLGVAEEFYLNARLKAEDRSIFTADRSFFTPINRREAVLADRSPKVILSTSGMCEGLAAYYLSAFITDPQSLLMLVGYQARGNLGRLLLDGANHVTIDGNVYPVNIQVESVGLSGHADREQIITKLEGQKLKNLITVHGDSAAMHSFITAAQSRVHAKKFIKIKIGQKVTLY